MRTAIVANPTRAGWERALDGLADAAQEAGWPEPEVALTSREETGRSQARAAADAGAELVLAAGGDGTTRAVAQGLAGSGAELGIVPIGTANLLAHNLGLPTDVPGALRTALEGTPRALDLGLARIDEEEDEQPFVVLAGMGHDAATVAATRPELKDRLGWPAYLTPAARHALRRPVPVTVRHDDGDPREMLAWSILAANCSRVRAGVTLAPGGELDDGLFDVLEVTVRRPDQWLAVAAKGVLGHRRDVAGLRTRPAATLEITAEDPLLVQLDGDTFGPVTRLRLRCEPQALSVRT